MEKNTNNIWLCESYFNLGISLLSLCCFGLPLVLFTIGIYSDHASFAYTGFFITEAALIVSLGLAFKLANFRTGLLFLAIIFIGCLLFQLFWQLALTANELIYISLFWLLFSLPIACTGKQLLLWGSEILLFYFLYTALALELGFIHDISYLLGLFALALIVYPSKFSQKLCAGKAQFLFNFAICVAFILNLIFGLRHPEINVLYFSLILAVLVLLKYPSMSTYAVGLLVVDANFIILFIFERTGLILMILFLVLLLYVSIVLLNTIYQHLNNAQPYNILSQLTGIIPVIIGSLFIVLIVTNLIIGNTSILPEQYQFIVRILISAVIAGLSYYIYNIQKSSVFIEVLSFIFTVIAINVMASALVLYVQDFILFYYAIISISCYLLLALCIKIKWQIYFYSFAFTICVMLGMTSILELDTYTLDILQYFNNHALSIILSLLYYLTSLALIIRFLSQTTVVKTQLVNAEIIADAWSVATLCVVFALFLASDLYLRPAASYNEITSLYHLATINFTSGYYWLSVLMLATSWWYARRLNKFVTTPAFSLLFMLLNLLNLLTPVINLVAALAILSFAVNKYRLTLFTLAILVWSLLTVYISEVSGLFDKILFSLLLALGAAGISALDFKYTPKKWHVQQANSAFNHWNAKPKLNAILLLVSSLLCLGLVNVAVYFYSA